MCVSPIVSTSNLSLVCSDSPVPRRSAVTFSSDTRDEVSNNAEEEEEEALYPDDFEEVGNTQVQLQNSDDGECVCIIVLDMLL